MRPLLTPFRRGIFVTLLLTIHVVLLSINAYVHFATRNEVAHLPAGLSNWYQGVFSLYNVNPPLWRIIAVLPVLPLDPKVDELTFPQRPGQRTEWASARAFADANASQYMQMVRLSRIAGFAWSVLGAIVLYHCASQLYGHGAGFFALALWCFDPNILAHAALMTPDIPLTVAVFGATFLFWNHLQAPSYSGAFLCGMALGVAELTKFTALVLYFLWPLLWLVFRFRNRTRLTPDAQPLSLRSDALQMVVLLTTSLLVINLGYDFDSSFQPLKDFHFVSQDLRGTGDDKQEFGNRFKDSWLGQVPVPLPADFVVGLDVQRLDFEKKLPSYLNGEIRDHGWWYYYLYAFVIKVPVGTIVLLLSAVASTAFRPGRIQWRVECCIWLTPLCLFALVSSQTGFNHHFRYVLPIFPFLYLGIARIACFLDRKKLVTGGLVLGLLGWSIVSSLLVFPHSLSYFNEVVGGPDHGSEHLIDSNIDWGQDLLFLKQWIEEHPEARTLAVAYHNYIRYQVTAKIDLPAPPNDPPKDLKQVDAGSLQSYGPHPGYFAVDIYNLILGPYTYLQKFTPVAKAGYSIHIYHLTLDEANAIRWQMGLPRLVQLD